jgi:hypothetical protein
MRRSGWFGTFAGINRLSEPVEVGPVPSKQMTMLVML